MIGILSRENGVLSLPLSAGAGNFLQILVESQGRINYNIADDLKGIVGNIFLNNRAILGWNTTGFPLDKSNLFNDLRKSDEGGRTNAERLDSGPVIFEGKFNLSSHDIQDTYINTTNWGKVRNSNC